jgi:hypothetical protein
MIDQKQNASKKTFEAGGHHSKEMEWICLSRGRVQRSAKAHNIFSAWRHFEAELSDGRLPTILGHISMLAHHAPDKTGRS